MTPVPGDVVDAVFRAMLGRSPDEGGLTHWKTAPDVDAVIAGVAGAGEYHERLRALASTAGLDVAEVRLPRWWSVLQDEDGITSVRGIDGAAAALAAAQALPFARIVDGLTAPHVVAVGPSARPLASELVRRYPDTRAAAGLSALGNGAPDVLVLTEHAILEVLETFAPRRVAAVRRRLVVPYVPATHETDAERGLRITHLRTALHRHGFLEVAHVVRRRLGDVVEDHGTSLWAPGALPHPLPAASVSPARAAVHWFVASRRPTVAAAR